MDFDEYLLLGDDLSDYTLESSQTGETEQDVDENRSGIDRYLYDEDGSLRQRVGCIVQTIRKSKSLQLDSICLM
jgi:hypothetical protein